MNRMDELRIKVQQLESGMERMTEILMEKISELRAAKDRVAQLERIITDKVIDQILERGL